MIKSFIIQTQSTMSEQKAEKVQEEICELSQNSSRLSGLDLIRSFLNI